VTLEPAKLAASIAAAERLEADRDAVLRQWRLGVERASYEASRAERRYRAVDPDNRLVARGLEREWEEKLRELESAKAELARRERERPRILTQAERDRLLSIGPDLAKVWHAPCTTSRDRKELLRALVEEVTIKVERDKAAAHLMIRWKGGAIDEIDLALPRSRLATIRTDEDTIALVRRLACYYPDSVIAGIVNRQGRTTAYGHRFQTSHVASLRNHWNIPCFERRTDVPDGELLTVRKAAAALAIAPSTLHRLLNDGIIAGEQPTPGGCTVAHSIDRYPRCSLQRRSRRRLPAHAGSNACTQGLPPNCVAACQARRARGSACRARQTKRSADQGDRPPTTAVQPNLMTLGAV
jgi:hypothetical protein